MSKELSRRELLTRLGGSALVGAAVAGYRSSAWGQVSHTPQFSREDMVHLYEGPWRGLRAVVEKKVIDFHTHPATLRTPDLMVPSVENLISSMDTHGIAKACVECRDFIRPPRTIYETAYVLHPGWCDEVVKEVGQYPDRFVIFYDALGRPPYRGPEEAAGLARRRFEAGARGLGELDADNLKVEEVRSVMEVAEEFDFPVLWGVRAGAYAQRDPQSVGKFATAFPNVTHIIADGGGRGFAHGGGWQAIIVAASYPNVYIELPSGAPVEIIDGAVQNLGAEKIVFGSNFTSGRPRLEGLPIHRDGSTHWRNLNAVALSNTTEAQRELILYKNAERLLKLDVRG